MEDAQEFKQSQPRRLLIVETMAPNCLVNPHLGASPILVAKRLCHHFHGRQVLTVTRRGDARPSLPSSMKRRTSSPAAAGPSSSSTRRRSVALSSLALNAKRSSWHSSEKLLGRAPSATRPRNSKRV